MPEPGETPKTLPAVVVKGDASPRALPKPYAGGQVATGGRLGMLGNESVMDTPFSVTHYTSKRMQDQEAVTLADVLNRDSSIRFTGQTGGVTDSFYIRGFPINEGNISEFAFDGVYGVVPNYHVFPEYVERVEVLKGPAALLYGMSPNSGVGGVVNVVPKRAFGKDLTRFTADYGSDAQVGGHVDLSRRFGSDRQFGVRFNGLHRQGGTPLDNQTSRADVGALALDYRGEKWRATLDLIEQYQWMDAPTRPFVVASGIAVLHGWHLWPRRAGIEDPHPETDDFRTQTRDLYVPAGDVSFWQAALRDTQDELYAPVREAIATGAPLSLDLLYGDHEGGQRTITRFYMVPRHHPAGDGDDEPWLRLCSVSRHWNLDRADPR